MSEPSTPLMRQYAAIKKEHPNALLFFRLGDFYELFFEDAQVAARELQITLTSRNKEKGIAVPMCGVPYHAAEGYIAKLIRKGFKVAICEQMEDPRIAKKLVKREVTRVVTPGTAADSQLGAEENNFLACVAGAKDVIGFAALDLSTGEFRATEFRGSDADRRIREELLVLRPREVLFASSMPLFDQPRQQTAAPTAAAAPRLASLENATWAETPLEDWVFAPDYAIPLVENHFGVLSLEGFGLADRSAAATAAGAILHYIRSTQRGSLDHVDRIGYYERQDCLVLDAVTVRNLELLEPLFSGGGDNLTLFPLARSHRHSNGQAVASGMDAAPVDRPRSDRAAAGCGRDHGEGPGGARGIATLDGRHSRSRAPAEPRDPGNRQSARHADAGGVVREAPRGSRDTGGILCRETARVARASATNWPICASESLRRWKTSLPSR